jgi:phosphoribosylformimino-5-aminoimidazole carboxamide ribotide isomerase
MIIFPAMDLRKGKCVRLYQGEFSSSQVVGENPIEVALAFKEQGAEYLHIVDLDGALKGSTENLDIAIAVIEATGLRVQLGGGIRTMETIETLIEKGVSRVILGTAALNNKELVKEAVKRYREKIAVGIDAKNGLVAVDGWVNVSNSNYIDFAKAMEQAGVKTIIFTDISRDGTLIGPNIEATVLLNESVSCNIIASGGMKGMEDIESLAGIKMYGAIIGKALYSSRISLNEAIAVGKGRG